MQPIQWNEPRAFRDALNGGRLSFKPKELGIWLAVGIILFIVGRLIAATNPAPGWEIAFIAPMSIILIGVVQPWVAARLPSSVFLDVLTIDIRRSNIVRYKLSLFSEFQWDLNPGYATLCLRRKDGKPDVTTGVPLEMSREAISPFLESAIASAVIQQVLVVVITSAALDGGASFQTSRFGIAATWTGIGIILVRRRLSPTAGDLDFARLSSIPLCVVSYLMAHAIWDWRGVLYRSGL
jgi:hypothetical protein